MDFKTALCYGLLLLGSNCATADTIDHYMNIANNIPQMEMKADEQSQAWARSARTVLTLACDGIVDSLILANENAKQQGQPLFCLASGSSVSPEMLNDMIQQTYRSLGTSQTEKDKMTVSQIALIGMQKQYPCSAAAASTPAAPQTAAQTANWGNH